MKRVIRLVIVVYLSVGLGLTLVQNTLLYVPPEDAIRLERSVWMLREGVRIEVAVLHPGKRRALLYFGGNAEDVGLNEAQFSELYPEHTVYLLYYRGYGRSEGSPSEVALYGDAVQLYDWAAPQHDSVSVVGRSLGAGLASYVAAQREVDRVAVITPYDSIAAVAQERYPLYPVSWMLRDHYDAESWAAQIRAPVLVLVARDDRVIPNQHTRRYIAALGSPDPVVREFVDVDHNSIQSDAGYAAALRAFFQYESYLDDGPSHVAP